MNLITKKDSNHMNQLLDRINMFAKESSWEQVRYTRILWHVCPEQDTPNKLYMYENVSTISPCVMYIVSPPNMFRYFNPLFLRMWCISKYKDFLTGTIPSKMGNGNSDMSILDLFGPYSLISLEIGFNS